MPEIASVTGHSFFTVHQVLRRYLPLDSICAWNALEKRSRMRVKDEPSELIVENVRRSVAPMEALCLPGPT